MSANNLPENLTFFGNWRRVLLLVGQSSVDIDEPVAYVALDAHKLPQRIKKFCELNWSEFEFDFDPYSYLLWPLDDKVSSKVLTDKLNEKFPGLVKVVSCTPAEAHDLDFTFEARWDNLLE